MKKQKKSWQIFLLTVVLIMSMGSLFAQNTILQPTIKDDSEVETGTSLLLNNETDKANSNAIIGGAK